MTKFKPSWDSVRTHTVPAWYDDAKLGIFITWGLYSVPGWVTPTGELGKVDFNRWFRENPYAEWYSNTQRIEGTPTWEYHKDTYGEHIKY